MATNKVKTKYNKKLSRTGYVLDKNGKLIYLNPNNKVLSTGGIISNTMVGATAGNEFGTWGQIIGGGLGLASGILDHRTELLDQEKADELKRKNRIQLESIENRSIMDRDEYILDSHNTQGNDLQYMFRNGGKLQKGGKVAQPKNKEEVMQDYLNSMLLRTARHYDDKGNIAYGKMHSNYPVAEESIKRFNIMNKAMHGKELTGKEVYDMGKTIKKTPYIDSLSDKIPINIFEIIGGADKDTPIKSYGDYEWSVRNMFGQTKDGKPLLKEGGKLKNSNMLSRTNNKAVPLSSDSIKFRGDTHNQDTDGDGQGGIPYKGNEVEGGEVLYKTSNGEELVFSKARGYAKMVEPMLRSKGNLEKDLLSVDMTTRNTAFRRLSILDKKVKDVFNHQEATNPDNQQPQLRRGGRVLEPGGRVTPFYMDTLGFNRFDSIYKDAPNSISYRSEVDNTLPLKSTSDNNQIKTGNEYDTFNNISTGVQSLLPIMNMLSNRRRLGDIPSSLPTPATVKAIPMKTDFNISSTLNDIDKSRMGLSRMIDRNVSSSNSALSRKTALQLASSDQKARAYQTKENAETQMINADAQNRQRVNLVNTNILNRHGRDNIDYIGSRVNAYNNLDNAMYQNLQNIVSEAKKGNYDREAISTMAAQYGIDIAGKSLDEIIAEMFSKIQQPK